MAVKTAITSEASTLKYEKQMFSCFKECPYVIKCYGDMETERGESEKIYNLFLEYCSGGSLYDHIKKGYFKGLLEEEVRCFTRDIVRGLHYLHSNLIVHCDIKPDNILLAPGSDGRLIAKIADFGLAKNLDYEDWEEISHKGTYRYMSPEMVKDKTLACPADIWALGCVLIEMLSGKPGWECVTKEELFAIIGYTSELPLFPKNISGNAKDFLSKCLIRDFQHRWTAEELLRHHFLSVDA
ncbi:hypothetical protein Pint_25292 [Pistacia integerrima]|uniref:Uncharacterized protein n=2 Tax=Pistacia TaxID=55512 RepID=A0ACC0YIT3_9ROSI|nr:hypothetical protein Pint_25292 [Pistacia integerrima]